MEEKSKKDQQALLNQGEENELVSLPLFLLILKINRSCEQGLLRCC